MVNELRCSKNLWDHRPLMRIAVTAAILAGCYRPSPPAGAECNALGQCPDPLQCIANVCVEPGTIDAPPPDVAIDADLTCTCSNATTLSCASGDTPCDLGCSTTGVAHCKILVPSNNVDPTLVIGTGGTSITALTTFDTDTGAITGDITRPAGSGIHQGIAYSQTASLAVFAFGTLTISNGGIVHFTGSRAAVFLVATDLELAGVIDASGGCYGASLACPGPGGGAGGLFPTAATGCGPGGTGAHDVATGADTGGGGGGGSTAGAAGGIETASTVMFAGGTAGPSCIPLGLEPLIGGSGGGGGGPGASTTPTPGGGGGGGLQLTALKSLAIAGRINAGGAGGDTGPLDASNGGASGGGGAGGGILLESPMVLLGAGTIIAANGGGGGGASDHLVAGQPGQNGQLSATPAAGGTPAPNAGAGGAGGAGVTPPAKGGDASSINAGAGGGAVGTIFIRAANQVFPGAVISPAPGMGSVRSI